MSMLPDVSAVRVVSLPDSPHFSWTLAPADCRARLVMWQRMTCSVNSLEPTVKLAPFSEPPAARLPGLAEVAVELSEHPAVTVARVTARAVTTVRSGRRCGYLRMSVLLITVGGL